MCASTSWWNRLRVPTAISRVHVVDRFGRPGALHTRRLAIATGYYDLPNYLNIPGEELSKVHHYYDDPHPYFDIDVVVIGGKNSAAIAALELWRHGARVTLVHRGGEIHRHVKYWIKPDIENRIKNGEIRAFFHSHVVEITTGYGGRRDACGRETLRNDFVFAMTGYRPDFRFLESMGVRVRGARLSPGVRSGNAGKQRPGNLPGGRNRGRLAHQRDLHRERPLSRQTDCARSKYKIVYKFIETNYNCQTTYWATPPVH